MENNSLPNSDSRKNQTLGLTRRQVIVGSVLSAIGSALRVKAQDENIGIEQQGTPTSRLLVILDKIKQDYIATLNNGNEFKGDQLEQYERFKKDFEHRLSARLHTLSISQKKALNGISYNYQTFYSAIVQIANNSPQAKDDLTDVARSLVAAQKNVNLNIVIPPAELDENKVGKKSADMYRNALRTYNDNMGKILAEMASVSKAIPEDSRNVDGIFRIVASDCLNQTNAAVATSSIRAIPAEFAKEILSFNVSIREKGTTVPLEEAQNDINNENEVVSAPSGTNLIKDAWPFKSLQDFSYSSKAGAPITLDSKRGEVVIQTAPQVSSSNYIRAELKVRGGDIYVATVSVVELDPQGNNSLRFTAYDKSGKTTKQIFDIKKTGTHTFNYIVPSTIENPGAKPGKTEKITIDLVQMQGDKTGKASPKSVFGGLHVARKH